MVYLSITAGGGGLCVYFAETETERSTKRASAALPKHSGGSIDFDDSDEESPLSRLAALEVCGMLWNGVGWGLLVMLLVPQLAMLLVPQLAMLTSLGCVYISF